MNDTYNRRFRLLRVIDGDTVHALIDLGWRIYSEHSVRLLGVNAPELFSGTERGRGQIAKDYVVDWFTDHAGHSGSEWPFTLHSERDHETFNRYLASIECGEGHSLADALVASGNAVRV